MFFGGIGISNYVNDNTEKIVSEQETTHHWICDVYSHGDVLLLIGTAMNYIVHTSHYLGRALAIGSVRHISIKLRS